MLEVIPPRDPNNNEGEEGRGKSDLQTSEDQLDVRASSRTASVVGAIHLWIFFCLHYISICLKRLSELILIQAEINKKSAKEGSLKNGLYQSLSFENENVPTVVRQRKVLPKFEKVITVKNECWVPELHKSHQARLGLEWPVSRHDAADSVVAATDEVGMLLSAVQETKIITTVFEVKSSGVGSVLEDLEQELQLWFVERGLLVVCSELVWSVPGKFRDPRAECQMKEGLFRALRLNNRRVLDLGYPRSSTRAPICLPEATTEEVSGKEISRGCYQGIYRRFYGTLVPLRHEDAVKEHDHFWSFNPQHLQPRPERFLMGRHRRPDELATHCLLALNLLALKIRTP